MPAIPTRQRKIPGESAWHIVATGWQGRLSVIDGSDPSSPRVVRDVEVPGYVQNLTVIGNTAVASLGYDGVQTIELD